MNLSFDSLSNSGLGKPIKRQEYTTILAIRDLVYALNAYHDSLMNQYLASASCQQLKSITAATLRQCESICSRMDVSTEAFKLFFSTSVSISESLLFNKAYLANYICQPIHAAGYHAGVSGYSYGTTDYFPECNVKGLLGDIDRRSLFVQLNSDLIHGSDSNANNVARSNLFLNNSNQLNPALPQMTLVRAVDPQALTLDLRRDGSCSHPFWFMRAMSSIHYSERNGVWASESPSIPATFDAPGYVTAYLTGNSEYLKINTFEKYFNNYTIRLQAKSSSSALNRDELLRHVYCLLTEACTYNQTHIDMSGSQFQYKISGFESAGYTTVWSIFTNYLQSVICPPNSEFDNLVNAVQQYNGFVEHLIDNKDYNAEVRKNNFEAAVRKALLLTDRSRLVKKYFDAVLGTDSVEAYASDSDDQDLY